MLDTIPHGLALGWLIIRIISFLNARHWKDAHYLDIEAVCEWESGDLKICDAFESLDWYDLESLPEPLIVGDKNGLEALKTGQVYFGNT